MLKRGRCAAGLLGLLVMVLCACSAPSIASGQQPMPSNTIAAPHPAASATNQQGSSTTTHSSRTSATRAPHQVKPPKGNPVGVRIARAGRTVLEAPIGGPIGLPANGILEPTDDTVRWYKAGTWPKPGYSGPSVLVGHITFLGNKGVFWSLGNSRPGDVVTVRYSSGQAVAFRVTALQHLAKTKLPVGKIWNATAKPELRLITCDPNTPFANGHYAGNIIVYADVMLAR